jgi:imidazolonepropionase-like amidohydrolase
MKSSWTGYLATARRILAIRLALHSAMIAVTIIMISTVVQAATPTRSETLPKVTAIRAGHLFEGTGDTWLTNAVIVIADGRIRAVGLSSQVPIPKDAQVIDLSGTWVLPGLIDCHVHLSIREESATEIYPVKCTPFKEAFAAVKNAETTLRAGFTTVRDLGSMPFLAVDLRDAIQAGTVVGPRVVASGPMISRTGGHGDVSGFAPAVKTYLYPSERDFGIADGPEELRRLVRTQVKYGVDVIKLAATGGVMSFGDQPAAPEYTIEELRAATEAAHMCGRKVAVHAIGSEGIKNALLAGVDSVEHGSLIDEEGIRLLKQQGAFLIFDNYSDSYIIENAAKLGWPEAWLAKERNLVQAQHDNLANAVKAGVKLAFGTDAGVFPHGQNAKQFALLVGAGMTSAAAIRSATCVAADLLGLSNDVGSLSPGRYGDVIAVAADPLQDVRVLENVRFVMKGGVVIKDELSKRR